MLSGSGRASAGSPLALLGPSVGRGSFQGAIPFALCACVLGASGLARAQQRPILADSLAKVRIDGLLREWPGSGIGLEGGKGKAKVDARIGYDAGALYLGFEVEDPTIKAGADKGVLVLDAPLRGGGHQTYRIEVFAGEPGKTAGKVRVNGAAAPGGKVVEAPIDGGYSMEAKIPWAALPLAAKVRVGLRAELQYVDSGSGTLRSRKAPCHTEAEAGLWRSLADEHVPVTPSHSRVGNVHGGAELELVAVYGRYLTIVGPGYQKGEQFYRKDLVVPDHDGVTRLELRDLDADGKDEIVLQRRPGDASVFRETFEVLKVQPNGAAEREFAHEIGIVTPEGRIRNEVELKPRGGKVAIVIRQGKAEGFSRDTFREPPQEGMESALLPWETVGSKTFAYDGQSYALSSQTEQKPRGLKAGKPPGSAPAAAPAGVLAPPPPRPPNAAEMQEKLYRLYLKERGLEEAKPRFDFVTDVAEDEELERVLVHEKEVLVFGKAYRRGASYAYIDLGFSSPDDVKDVTARDLTGDGKAEVIVRGVLHAKAGKELEDEEVQRYAVLVYRVRDTGIERIFGAETGRAMGDSRVLGNLSFRPAAQGFDIVISPGRAVGWSQRTYPFDQDEGSAGGLEPLILPWTRGVHRYAFSGGAYSPQ